MSTTKKIAVVTDDGVTISDHFGRARYYQVFSVVDGSIADSQMLDRAGTIHHGREHGEGTGHHGDVHGTQHGAADRHARMIGQISDCSALITRGMGRGAQVALAEAGIATRATSMTGTQEAVEALLAGTLPEETSRIH